MELTPNQKDSLTELISIGYGRAASALSDLTGHRVTLEVPHITIHKIGEIPALLAAKIPGEVAMVDQAFSGPITGNAVLMLDEKSAIVLSQLLCEDDTIDGAFDATGRETITEIGNILLNACLGVFGNVLQIQVTFAVPRLQVSVPGNALATLKVDNQEIQYGLMIHTHFQIRDSNITGYLIIILGITSLDRMLLEVSAWERRQTS